MAKTAYTYKGLEYLTMTLQERKDLFRPYLEFAVYDENGDEIYSFYTNVYLDGNFTRVENESGVDMIQNTGTDQWSFRPDPEWSDKKKIAWGRRKLLLWAWKTKNTPSQADPDRLSALYFKLPEVACGRDDVSVTVEYYKSDTKPEVHCRAWAQVGEAFIRGLVDEYDMPYLDDRGKLDKSVIQALSKSKRFDESLPGFIASVLALDPDAAE